MTYLNQKTSSDNEYTSEGKAVYLDLRPASENYKRCDDLINLPITIEKKKTKTIKTWSIVSGIVLASCALSACVTYFAVYEPKELLNKTPCKRKDCGLENCQLSSYSKPHCNCSEEITEESCQNCEFRISEVQRSCPDNWTTHGMSCYKEVNERKTWFQAKDYCRGIGADLLSVHDQKENEFLIRTFPLNREMYWIGLHNCQNKFVNWIDGTWLRYTNWASGEPNNVNNNENCVHVGPTSDGKWNDINCYMSLKSICKMNRTTQCGSGSWTYFNGSCYTKTNVSDRWIEARRFCQRIGADLVNIQSSNEYHFLLSWITKFQFGFLWIGLNDREKNNQYLWSDGSTPNFFSWDRNEPNRNDDRCVEMGSAFGNWAKTNCNKTLEYICEKKTNLG